MNEHSFLTGKLAIPVSFCCLELGSDFFEYSTKVLSVFNEGFVITSPRRLRMGMVLSLRLRVPSDRLDGKPSRTADIGGRLPRRGGENDNGVAH